jgi:hypothetical protein
MIETPQTPSSFKGLLRQISIVGLALALTAGSLFATTTVLSQETTSPAVPEEQVKENIKERLEQAIKDQDTEIKLKRAWVGILDSIANHTLTIETREGPKLASISAESAFVLFPKKTAITAEDLEIGSYTIAMGFLSENQVLNARRIIVQKEIPESLTRQALFASSIEYDTDKELIIANFASGETDIFELDRDTEITIGKDSEIIKASVEDIEKGQRAIIITKIEEDEETKTTLIRIHLLPKKEAELEPEAQEASQSATQSPTPTSE